MKIDVVVHIHHDHGTEKEALWEARWTELVNRIGILIQQGGAMAGELARITAAVALVNGKADSLIELTGKLAQFIRDNLGNPAALTALAEQLEAQAGEVQAAIDANPLPSDNPPPGGGTATALPDGTVGVAYAATLATPAGAAPFGFTVETGALPDGLALDLTSGLVSGTPTAAGDSAFTVRVQDADATTTDEIRSYTLKVNPA